MEFLKPSQTPHCNRLLDILEESLFACDFSVMGAGKTWVGNAIGVETGLPLMVLGPRGSLTNWETVGDDMGGQVIFTSTYESLRSIRGCQPKHGYLQRYDYEDGSVGFAPTKAFRDLAKEGIILICDECQKIKNSSDQTKAVRALVREILDNGGKSRLMLLSGSPFEESKHALNFFRFVGFVTHPKMYNISKSGDFTPLGLAELIDNLNHYAPEEVEQLVITHSPFTKKSVGEFVFAAFTEIIVPFFSSAMPSPAVDFRKDVGNGYYRFETEEEATELINAIQGLQRAAAFNPREGTINYDNNNMGIVTTALRRVELAKVPLFARKTRETLAATEKGKVVIFFNYTEPIDRLRTLLAEFDPIVYDGRLTSRKQEDAAIAAFQTGGHRVLIANLKKGGITINLHDTIGDEPRTTYMSPTFSILDMHQASARTYRQGLKSDAIIRAVYGEVGTEDMRILESRILAALSRKTENLKKILIQQAKEGVLFPGEYPDIHEPAL